MNKGRSHTAPPPPPPRHDDLDVMSLFAILWRRKLIILLVIILGLVAAYFALNRIEPVYTSTSIILVEDESQQRTGIDLAQILKSRSFDTTFVQTELQVLKSRKLAAEVVRRLGLTKDPEFSYNAPNAAAQNQKFRDLSVDGSQMRTLPPEAVDAEVSVVINRFLENLKVAAVPGSVAIKIDFTSRSPAKAAVVANTVVDAYIDRKVEEQLSIQQRVTAWLDERLQTLKQQLFDAETKIQRFKAENELNEKKIDLVSEEQAKELNRQLSQAVARKSKIDVTLKQLKKTGRFEETLSLSVDTVKPGLIKELRLDEVRLNKSLSELSDRYGPKHPKIIEKQAEIGAIQQSLELEKQKIQDALQTELNIAQARIRDIENRMDDAAVEVSQNTDALVQLSELEREAESYRLVLQTFLESYKKSIGREALQSSGVKIISDANIPQIPSYPDKRLFFALSIFISTFLGFLIAILLEKKK